MGGGWLGGGWQGGGWQGGGWQGGGWQGGGWASGGGGEGLYAMRVDQPLVAKSDGPNFHADQVSGAPLGQRSVCAHHPAGFLLGNGQRTVLASVHYGRCAACRPSGRIWSSAV